jgi:hypothetical protein
MYHNFCWLTFVAARLYHWIWGLHLPPGRLGEREHGAAIVMNPSRRENERWLWRMGAG